MNAPSSYLEEPFKILITPNRKRITSAGRIQ